MKQNLNAAWCQRGANSRGTFGNVHRFMALAFVALCLSCVGRTEPAPSPETCSPWQSHVPEEERDLDEVGVYELCEPRWYQGVRLDLAYEGRDREMLSEFFRGWHDQSVAASLDGMPDVVRHAYAVFDDFFTPQDTVRFGTSRRRQGYFDYTNLRYFIVQNELRLVLTDDVLDRWRTWQLSNEATQEMLIEAFRPTTAFPDRVLYLTGRYQEWLDEFVRGRSLYDADSVPAFEWDEQTTRTEFLRPLIYIRPGNMNNWLETNPRVDMIRFDTEFRYAAVKFCFIPECGAALYRRDESGVWRMIDFSWTGVM